MQVAVVKRWPVYAGGCCKEVACIYMQVAVVKRWSVYIGSCCKEVACIYRWLL